MRDQRARAIERATRPGESVRAIDVLGRVGISSVVTVDDVKARLIEQVREIRGWAKDAGVTENQLEQLLDSLGSVWR